MQFRTVAGTDSPATRHPTYGSPISYSLQSRRHRGRRRHRSLARQKDPPELHAHFWHPHSVSVECRDRPQSRRPDQGSVHPHVRHRADLCVHPRTHAPPAVRRLERLRLGRWRFHTTTHGQKSMTILPTAPTELPRHSERPKPHSPALPHNPLHIRARARRPIAFVPIRSLSPPVSIGNAGSCRSVWPCFYDDRISARHCATTRRHERLVACEAQIESYVHGVFDACPRYSKEPG